jgi:pimeloyl-ACP methyl ester carboxylesterase
MQRQIIFPRSQIQAIPPAKDNHLNIEKKWLDTEYGKIETWFMPPRQGEDEGPYPVVIFGHGNAELIDFWPEYLNNFTRLGTGVLLVEYPGYGRSEGSPSQKAITGVFTAAYDNLISRGDVDSSRIILFGRSIGGGAVCALAAVRPSAALILMSTFRSVRSLASKYLLPGFFVRDSFDNLSVVKTYAGPICIIHGVDDKLIPYAHGDALNREARQGRIITYNSGHNDCPPDWIVFWQDMESFLHEIGII